LDEFLSALYRDCNPWNAAAGQSRPVGGG